MAKFLSFTLICIILLCICTIHTGALPTVLFPLKPSPATGPYQDEVFLELANRSIHDLSNQTIPNGTSLRDLQTTQQQLARMNISPRLYPRASLINAYLYYTAKAGDSYSDAMSLSDKPYSPLYKDIAQTSEAREYQAASQVIWEQLKDWYPEVKPYILSASQKPFSTNEDPNFKWPPNSPFV